jgi:Uma2 family endonuclease
VVFPDLAIHCTPDVPTLPATDTAIRTPEMVIELLSDETQERDRAPRGAKFLAYELSGVREYYYAWPDGREAAGFRLESGVLVPMEPDAQGYFRSSLLAARFRILPPSLIG